MAVYREGFSWLGELVSASKQIFDDACDYGVLVNKDDTLWNTAKNLTEWYGIEGTRKHINYPTGSTTSIEIYLLDEWAVSDQRKTMEEAETKYIISYIKSTAVKTHDALITIIKK
jgi:hypothetical protein